MAGGPPGEAELSCDHTKDLYDASGRRMGSWVNEQTERDGIRVVCEACGKFYGYIGREPGQKERPAKEREWLPP